MKKRHVSVLITAVTMLSFQNEMFAGEGETNSVMTKTFSLDDNFRKGWREATFGSGVMLSPGIFDETTRPTVNWVSFYGQAGYMLRDVQGSGFFRGNLELAPEVFSAAIWKETGSYIIGWTLYGRYNFVQPDWKVVPYLQLGLGTVWTDIDQKYTGQEFNFNLDAALGLRYFIKPRVSLNLEYRLTHISNANTGDHNIGINGSGPVVGVSWFF